MNRYRFTNAREVLKTTTFFDLFSTDGYTLTPLQNEAAGLMADQQAQRIATDKALYAALVAYATRNHIYMPYIDA